MFFYLDYNFLDEASLDHLIVINAYIFTANSVMFFFTCFYFDEKKIYNYYLGIFCMICTTITTAFCLKNLSFP